MSERSVNRFPFALLQSIFLIVIFYLMVNLYHRSLYVLRTYRYLGKLEDEIRHLLKLEEDLNLERDTIFSFTREGRFYQAERPTLQLLVKWFYIALVGILLLAFFGGRVYYDFTSSKTLLAGVDLLVACATLVVFYAYATSSVKLDTPEPQETPSTQQTARTGNLWVLAGILFGGAGVLLIETFDLLDGYAKWGIFMGSFAFVCVIATALTEEFFTQSTQPWPLIPGGVSAITGVALLLASFIPSLSYGSIRLGILSSFLFLVLIFIFRPSIANYNWSVWWPAAILCTVLVIVISAIVISPWALLVLIAVVVVAAVPRLPRTEKIDAAKALFTTPWVVSGLIFMAAFAAVPILLQTEKIDVAEDYLKELQNEQYEAAYYRLCIDLRQQDSLDAYTVKAQAWVQANEGIQSFDVPWAPSGRGFNTVTANVTYGNDSTDTFVLGMSSNEQETWKVCQLPSSQ